MNAALAFIPDPALSGYSPAISVVSAMDFQAVVDLLSTDEDAPVHPMPSKSKAGAKTLKHNLNPLLLSDPVDSSEELTGSRSTSVAKRQKLSPFSHHELLAPSNRSVKSTISARDIATPMPDETGCCHDTLDVSEDILFTSSACISSNALPAAEARPDISSGASEDDFPDDIFSLRDQNIATRVSDRTASFLAQIRERKTSAAKKSTSIATSNISRRATKVIPVSSGKAQDGISTDDELQGVKHTRVKAVKKHGVTEEDKALKAIEKEAAKEAKAMQRAKEKEVVREKRRLEREEKAREKQRVADLAEVNKSKKDRKETSKEMIVDLPISIAGARVEDQIKEFLKNQGIETTSYQSSVPNIIRWRRRVDSFFDEEKGHRVAIMKEIRDEKHIACLMSAKEFVELVTASSNHMDNERMDQHIRKVKSKFAGCEIMYIIEGLDAWMRRNKNARNRVYQTAVMAQTQTADDITPAASQQKSRRMRQVDAPIDDDMIEDALLRLQIVEECLVHHTNTTFESAEWVANFTQHISQIPYRFYHPYPAHLL